MTPLINHVNDLDDRIGQNSRDLKAVDARVTQDLNSLTAGADTTAQNVAAAGQRAGAAEDAANATNTKLTSLESTLANVDNYRSLTEKSVQFRPGDSKLSQESQAALDELATAIPNAPNYIITVEGATDTVGTRDYNIALSQQRAEAVIRYLASKHNIPAYRMRSVGIGQEKPVAPNNTAAGRAQNRRAEVALLSASNPSQTQGQQANSNGDTTATPH